MREDGLRILHIDLGIFNIEFLEALKYWSAFGGEHEPIHAVQSDDIRGQNKAKLSADL